MRPVGWRYDSARHSLAAKGVKTRTYNYKPISLRPKFAEGLQQTWDDVRDMRDSGNFLWRSSAAKARERERQRASALKLQGDQYAVAARRSSAPLTAEEQRRVGFKEASLMLSAGLRAKLAREETSERFKEVMDNLFGAGGNTIRSVQQAIEDRRLTPKTDEWVADASNFVSVADVQKTSESSASEMWKTREMEKLVDDLKETLKKYAEARSDIEREKVFSKYSRGVPIKPSPYGYADVIFKQTDPVTGKVDLKGGRRYKETINYEMPDAVEDVKQPLPESPPKVFKTPIGEVKIQMQRGGGLRNE